MIPEQFAILTVILSFTAGIKYVVGTLKGETQPNRVTWGLYTLFGVIILAAQLSEGVGWPIASAAIVTFNTALILAASFINPKAYWKSDRRDYLFGAIALIGLVLWRITDNANIALLFSLSADAFATIPTVIKAYQQPESEDGKAFVIWGIAHIFVLLIITEWAFVNYAYSAYLVLFNFLLAYLILIQPRFSSPKTIEK